MVGGSRVGKYKGAVSLETYKQEEHVREGWGPLVFLVFLTVLGSEAPGKELLSLLRE